MENFGTFFTTSVQNQSEATAVLDKLVATARAEAAFSQPVTQGEHTVITASEVYVGMGLGFGSGGGETPAETGEDGKTVGAGYGGGGGGGGGGTAAARPVAAIVISPNGVHVEPIVDVTKIALAFFTTLGAMLLMFRGMKKGAGE